MKKRMTPQERRIIEQREIFFDNMIRSQKRKDSALKITLNLFWIIPLALIVGYSIGRFFLLF